MFGNRDYARPLTAAFSCACLGVGLWFGSRIPSDPTLTFISCGQGDATLIADQGTGVLIDVGPVGSADKVLRAVENAKVRHLKAIFLTHPDLDHTANLRRVLRIFPDATVYYSSFFEPQLRPFVEKCRARQARALTGRAKFGFAETGLEVFVPTWSGGNDNEGSLFIKIKQRNSTAVVTGDAGFPTEKVMIPYANWKVQILKCGHHGSRKSTSDEWLKATQPTAAVVSCGKDNSYGHPAKALLNRLQNYKLSVYRTDLQDDPAFVASESGYRPQK